MDDAPDIFCAKLTTDDQISTLKSAGEDKNGTRVKTKMGNGTGTTNNAQGGFSVPNPTKNNAHGDLDLRVAVVLDDRGTGNGSSGMEVCEGELPEGDVKDPEAMEGIFEEGSSNVAAPVSRTTKGELFEEEHVGVSDAMEGIIEEGNDLAAAKNCTRKGELPQGKVTITEAIEGTEGMNDEGSKPAATSSSCATKGELSGEGDVRARDLMEDIEGESSNSAVPPANCTTQGELPKAKIRVREDMEGIIEDGSSPAAVAAKGRTTKGVPVPPRSRSNLLQPTEAVQGVLDTVVQAMRTAVEHPDTNRGRISRPLFDSAPALLKLCEVSQARVVTASPADTIVGRRSRLCRGRRCKIVTVTEHVRACLVLLLLVCTTNYRTLSPSIFSPQRGCFSVLKGLTFNPFGTYLITVQRPKLDDSLRCFQVPASSASAEPYE